MKGEKHKYNTAVYESGNTKMRIKKLIILLVSFLISCPAVCFSGSSKFQYLGINGGYYIRNNYFSTGIDYGIKIRKYLINVDIGVLLMNKQYYIPYTGYPNPLWDDMGMGFGTSFEGNFSYGYNIFGKLFLKAGIGIGFKRQVDYYEDDAKNKIYGIEDFLTYVPLSVGFKYILGDDEDRNVLLSLDISSNRGIVLGVGIKTRDIGKSHRKSLAKVYKEANTKLNCDENKLVNIAVMPFEGDKWGVSFDIIKFYKDSCFKIIERVNIYKIIEEHKLALSGLTEMDYIKIGKLLNADYIIYGQAFERYKPHTPAPDIDMDDVDPVIQAIIGLGALIQNEISREEEGSYIYASWYKVNVKTAEIEPVATNIFIKKL